MTTVEANPIGFGRMKRKEDPRFIRGQGHYVDDLQLPGMLHGVAVLQMITLVMGADDAGP
jgi:carbon-monoxide dehydrogenase large subunit